MFIFPLFSFLLLILLLTSMMAKAKPWRKLEKPGKTLKTLPMGLWARIQIHRSALLAIGFALAFGLSAGWMQPSLGFIIGAFTVVMLFLPMQYTLTSEGVALGESNFRAWSEFSGMRALKGQVVLDHPQWLGRLTLFVNPSEMESVTKKIKKIEIKG
jgi:hypothetical protein